MWIKCLRYHHDSVSCFFTEVGLVPMMPLIVSVTPASGLCFSWWICYTMSGLFLRWYLPNQHRGCCARIRDTSEHYSLSVDSSSCLSSCLNICVFPSSISTCRCGPFCPSVSVTVPVCFPVHPSCVGSMFGRRCNRTIIFVVLCWRWSVMPLSFWVQ